MFEGYRQQYKESYIDAYFSIKPKWCECAAITGLFLVSIWILNHITHWFLPVIYVFALEASKIGVSRYILQIAKNKEEELTDFLYSFASLRNFTLLLVLAIIGVPAITLGFILLILPGVYLTMLISLVEFVAADQPKMTFT